LIASASFTYSAQADEAALIDQAVIIVCGQASGTGFYVDAQTIVTAKHVVEGCENMTITSNNKDTTSATVKYRDPVNDIATLTAAKTVAGIVTLSLETTTVGSKIQIVGEPINGLVLSSGTISDLYTNDEYSFQLDVAGDHGNSGGPVFLNGKVIGLVDAKDDSGHIYGMNAQAITNTINEVSTPSTHNVVTTVISNEGPLAFSVLLNVILFILSLTLIIARRKSKANSIVINI
jgi:S1-C subfamily serine protease